MDKNLKKDKLYICDIEYEYELESGTKGIAQEKLIGYVKGTKDCFFYGSVYGKEDNHCYGGETMRLTLKQFKEWVKSVKEIA